jgi:hypothetical protein
MANRSSKRLLLIACRGDKGLARYLHDKGYRIHLYDRSSRLWMSTAIWVATQGQHEVWNTCRDIQLVTPEIRVYYETWGLEANKPHPGLLNQIGLLTTLAAEEMPLLMASKARGRLRGYGWEMDLGWVPGLAKDLLEYRTR